MRRITHVAAVGLGSYMLNDPVDAITWGCVFGMLLLAGLLATRRQWLYSVLMVDYLVPAMLIDLPAIGRMTAILFPASLYLAPRLSRSAFGVWVLASSALQALLSMRFFAWTPPY
jgi:hypothetical protein